MSENWHAQLWAGHAGGLRACRFPLGRFANLYGSAHPFGEGWVASERYQRETPMTSNIPNFALCETTGKYQARRPLTEDQIIKAAKRILNRRVSRGTVVTSADSAKDYLVTYFVDYLQEVFACMFLDSQHQLIKTEVLFKGTVNASPVYPREVIRRCLELNAAAVIFAHNHPSGCAKPSPQDGRITLRLKDALDLVDVTTLDHIIVGGSKTYSFRDHGRI